MSHPASPSERIGLALADPGAGVLGLVDELLAVSRQRDLSLAWREGRCLVALAGMGSPDRLDAPLPRSVFRAVLARIAALCNERNPDSVSPYGGRGEVSVGKETSATIRVAFVNTPGEQRLELSSSRFRTEDGTRDPLSVPLIEADQPAKLG